MIMFLSVSSVWLKCSHRCTIISMLLSSHSTDLQTAEPSKSFLLIHKTSQETICKRHNERFSRCDDCDRNEMETLCHISISFQINRNPYSSRFVVLVSIVKMERIARRFPFEVNQYIVLLLVYIESSALTFWVFFVLNQRPLSSFSISIFLYETFSLPLLFSFVRHFVAFPMFTQLHLTWPTPPSTIYMSEHHLYRIEHEYMFRIPGGWIVGVYIFVVLCPRM